MVQQSDIFINKVALKLFNLKNEANSSLIFNLMVFCSYQS